MANNTYIIEVRNQLGNLLKVFTQTRTSTRVNPTYPSDVQALINQGAKLTTYKQPRSSDYYSNERSKYTAALTNWKDTLSRLQAEIKTPPIAGNTAIIEASRPIAPPRTADFGVVRDPTYPNFQTIIKPGFTPIADSAFFNVINEPKSGTAGNTDIIEASRTPGNTSSISPLFLALGAVALFLVLK